MTTTTAVLFTLLVSVIPGMALGMSLMGLFRSVRWSVLSGIVLAALGFYMMPSVVVAIPVGFVFFGIYCAKDNPDILNQMFS